MRFILFLTLCLTVSMAHAESDRQFDHQAEIEAAKKQEREAFLAGKSLLDLAFYALEQSLGDQVKEQDNRFYLPGEFTTQIQSTPIPSLIGVGSVFKPDEEATGFTTGSVINVLAQTYLDFPEYKNQAVFSKIPQAVSNGVATFRRYESGSVFNFYPPLLWKGVWVRRPIDMRLASIWHGITNIPNDSDSTSVMTTAKLFNAKLNPEQRFAVSQEVFDQLQQFRDIDRKAMFYNRLEHRKNTQGFLTWLMDENDPKMSHFYFSSSTKGERIPFNKNDVDCIVNANILKLISATRHATNKNLQVEGEKEACSLINNMIMSNEQAKCGIYYPNTLNLAFSMAQVEKSGNSCLTADTQTELLNNIMKLQSKHGYWKNKGNVWNDKVLTTAFAMYALLHYGDKQNFKTKQALINGVNFLMNSLQSKDKHFSWPADHYFTATAIARNLVMWESKAYTHAIISDVLLRFIEAYPDMKQTSALEMAGPSL
ncbi:hypothetical protein CIK05_05555 [Bdellovibrio sp. qaytius]|nr:hypothetical protein CIK05_05555 [Bdellovibrio sp. qaytius]